MWLVARRVRRTDDTQPLVSSDDAPRLNHEENYRQLRNCYLSVYSLATFGDWIQGGFLYALYAEYGYSQRDIGLIFVVGYASAMTIDSILYTSFESWVIAEADARRVPMTMLSRLFSVATFCNAGSAVIAGMVGHLAVEVIPHEKHNKFTSAFDVAVIVLLIAAALAATQWTERFGDQLGTASESLWRSCREIRSSRALFSLGLVNSFYEAALYVFVFLWTPALERRSIASGGGVMGHGLVFSIFMLSKMAGSQVFHILSQFVSPATCLQLVFSGSALALASTLVIESYACTLLAFCAFEGLLGIYWPAIALLRCAALSDAQRSSQMAVFRVLLNVLVITVLPLAGGLDEAYAFMVAVLMMLVCLVCIGVVKSEAVLSEAALTKVNGETSSSNGDEELLRDDGSLKVSPPPPTYDSDASHPAAVAVSVAEGLPDSASTREKAPLCTMVQPGSTEGRPGSHGASKSASASGGGLLGRAWDYFGCYDSSANYRSLPQSTW